MVPALAVSGQLTDVELQTCMLCCALVEPLGAARPVLWVGSALMLPMATTRLVNLLEPPSMPSVVGGLLLPEAAAKQPQQELMAVEVLSGLVVERIVRLAVVVLSVVPQLLDVRLWTLFRGSEADRIAWVVAVTVLFAAQEPRAMEVLSGPYAWTAVRGLTFPPRLIVARGSAEDLADVWVVIAALLLLPILLMMVVIRMLPAMVDLLVMVAILLFVSILHVKAMVGMRGSVEDLADVWVLIAVLLLLPILLVMVVLLEPVDLSVMAAAAVCIELLRLALVTAGAGCCSGWLAWCSV